MTLPPVDTALARAHAALEVARVMAAGGHLPDAVNRAYFAAFYAASALLSSIGMTAASHEGVRTLTSLHFVRTGKLSADAGRAFSHLASDRHDADYDLAAVFTPAAVAQAVADAESFVREVETLLAAA